MLNKNRKNKSNQTTLKLRAKKLSVKSIAMLALSFVMAISFSLGISTLYIAPQKVASAGLAEADTPTATYDLTGVSAFGSGVTSLKGTGINDTLVVNGTTFYLSGWNSNTEMKFLNGLYLKNRSAIVFDVPYKFDIRISFSHSSGRSLSFGVTKNTGDAKYYGSTDNWAKNATFGWSNKTTNSSTPITLEDQVAGTYMLSHVHNTSEITITKIEIWNVDSSTPSTYSVTYDGNGKTGGSVPTDGTSYENNGSVTVLGNTGSLVKTGYTFAGWNTKSDGSGTDYVAGNTFTISANTTLYAKWTANTYSIKFNANGGTGSMDNLAMTYGVAKNLTSNGFEHATLNFAGWATSENGEVVYSDGQSVENLTATQGETINLYAVWANTITASWVKGDGDWTISDNYAAEVYATNMHNVTTDVILANSNGIKITAKAGKTAYNDLTTDGANRVPALQNAATNAIEIILPEGFDGTITVQASAYSSSSRSISIAGQPQQSFSSGLGSPSTLTVDVATGGTVYIENLTADKTVYIHSITVTGTADEVVDPITYGVTYADGVDDEVITVPTDGNSYVEGATVTISSTVPSRDGYTFNGWTSSAFNGTKQAGATFTMPASAVTLTATWTENAVEVIKTINSVVAPTGDYSCYQNADVSTAGLPNTVVGNWTGSDGSSGTVNVPVEWSLDTSTTGTKTASGTLGAVSGYVLGVSTVSASVTVNALPANTVTLTFKNGSSTYTTLEVAEGSKPTRPADPTNNDALWFGGWWTKDGSSWGSNETYRSGLSAWGYVFDFDAELTEDTTVYALWIDPVDIVSFQAYIDNMVQNGIVDPYSKPMWGSEGFKGKWNYIDGVFLNSVVNLYYNTDENVTYTYTNWAGNTVTTSKKEFYLNFFTNFVSDYVNDDGEFLTVKSGSGPTSSTTSSTTLDFICESKILYDAYILTGEEKYIKAIENSKEILDKINKVNGSEITIDGVQYYNYSHQNGNGCSNEIWLDGMYMYAPFLTRYLKATNAESSDYQQLLAQYSFILQKMRDSETGLYYHGYAGTGNSDGYWENGGDACSPTFWSRSMGWFVTSLIDVIEYMPNDVPVADGIKARIPANFSTAYGNTIDTSNGKAFLQSMLKDAIDALLAHQDPNSKMFYQVIDGGITVDGYQNYLESSGSSMFAYTIMKAARLFLTGNSADGKSYAVRGQEVFEGIYNHSLNGTNLYDICKMADITDNGATTAYYLNNTDTQITSNDGKGSGPFVMAFVEYNALKNSVTPTAPTTPNINNRRVHVYNNSGFVETLEVVKGSTVSSIEAPAVSGYTFNGWYSDSNLTSSVSGSTVISEDTILYAKYTSDSATYYTVTFMSDGAEYLSTEIEENSTVNRPNDPTKSGYTFGGWFTEEACENEFNFATQITADTTLYAKWTEITGFIWDATEADANDGKVYSFSNGVFVFGTSGTLVKTTTNAGELDGKSLIYAEPNSSCRTLTLDIDQEYNVVLYVYVNTTSSRTITIGGVSNTVDLAADNEKGYYKYTGTVSQSKNTIVLSGSGVYWSRVELIKTGSTPTTYTVSFNSNGGSGSMSSQTFTAEVQQAIKENTFTRSGYTFAGWATSSNGSKVYNDTEVITVESNLTLYALWEESATKYTVTFDLNGGNIGGETEYSIEVSSGGYAVKPTNPEKTGSTFMGWYTTEDKSKNKDEFDFDEEAITANKTLYALWFESVNENAMISYIQGLMDGTDLTTMDQGEWNTETWRGYFNYVNGIFINSLVNLSYNTSDEAQKAEYEQFVVDYLERYIRQDGTIVQYASQTATPDPENASEFGNIVRIDFIQTVRTLFDAYEFSGDERFLKAVEYALDKFASAAKVEGTYNNPPHTPSNLNEIWLDGLYMYAPLYARYIAAGGKNSNYTALELFNQYTVVVDNMRDSETGLYYHGYAVDKDTSASPWADPETGLSASFWSRSVGWLAMSLVDVLDYYPSGVSINKSFNGNNYTDARAYLTAVFKDLMDSLLAYQDPDSKMFYQILNHDSIISDVSNDNYLETSGSAMFAYALMKGGKAGYLTGNFTTTAGESLSYNNIGRQIFEGVYAHSVSVSGSTVNVYDICGATSLSDADSDSMATYIGNDIVSNESKGTAPLILAFIEYFNEIVNAPVTPNVNERKIYIETNGGSHNLGVDYIVANINGTLSSSQLPELTKADYEFTGWYLDSALTIPLTFDSTILTEENTTLYAGWSLSDDADVYEITLDGNDGTFGGDQASITATVSQTNPELLSSHVPSRSGYEFVGFENSSGTLYFNADGSLCDGVVLSGGETLYAVWKPITITVTLNAGSGAFSDSSTEKVIEIAYGSSDDLTSEYIPSLSGYNFGGWEQDGSAVYDENGNFVYSAGYWNFTSNKTLTAVWTEIPTYSATFNVNYPDGVSSGVVGMPENVVDSVSESVVPNSPSLDGYIFLGWSENEGATSATYAPGATIDITSNPVLYAIWAEEGAGNTVNVNYDFSELKDSNTSYNLNNSGNIVVDGTTFTGNNNSHIYTKEATNGILLTSSQVVRKNYALVGWATSQFGEQVYQAGGTYVGSEEEITLYPVWEITGNTDNRTTSTVNGQLETHVWSSYVVNDAYDANNASSYYYMGSENDEYKNIRWTDLYKNNVTNGIYTISGGDSDNYAIKVDTNSGASVDADHRMVSEPLIKIDKKSNSTTYSPIEIVVAEGFTAKIKVYAVVYNKAGEISILASNKSTVISSSEVANKYGNTEFTENSAHELVNDFVGGITPNEVSASSLESGSYYISNTSANHIYITGIEIALAPTSNEYNVNFYNNESETDETVFETVLTFGGTLVLPNTQPTRNGYTFNGWFTQRTGGEKLAEGDVVNQETNLYAQWTANIYVVTFVADYPGDLTEGIENIPEQYNSLGVSSFVPDSIPTLAGYYFLGWATTENAESPVYARGTTIGVEGSMTLYTVWASEAVIVYDFSSLNLVTNKNANGNITIDGNNLTDQKWTVTTYIGANHTLLAQQNVSRNNYTITNWTTDGNEYLPGATFTATGSTHIFVPTFVPTNKNEIVAGNLVSSGTTTTWSTYVINGSGVATSAANATRWNIRWTDLYSAQNNAYTFIDNDYATFSANSSLVSVNADHLGTSEPMLASTSSESNRPYTFVVKPGYTATITVYAVVYSGSTTLTFYNGEGVAVSEGSTISASFGGSNTFPTNGVTPSVATVVDLEEGTYTLGNNGSEVYVLGVKVEASLRDDAVIHTVNFNTNGGSDVESKHVLNGNALEAPSAPTKPGFNFVGWFDQSLENEYEFPYTISNEVAQTITMYAKWQAIYTLTFNENVPAGATGSVGDMPANVTNNTTGSVVLAGEPTLSGYNFLGWDTVSNVASPTYKVGDEVDITSNPVLYAIWKKQATGVATGVDLFYNGAWGNGSTNKNVTDANVSNVLVTSVGMSSITLYAGDSGHMLDGVATDLNVLKTGGSTSASRYIKFTVPSSLYSSFKVALIASPNGDGTAVNMWLADSASKTVGSNTVIYTTSTVSKEYITGAISDSYPTMDENGDVTYFLNFSASSRIYRISLELTPVSQEGVERTISYQTDDESRPFAEAIEDGVVESGSPYTIPSTIPTTTNASYVFSHWEDEGGTRYNPGYEFSEVNADITLIAKWDMLITSITWIQPDNRQEISQANSEGVGLPSFATAVSVQNTTLPITWQVNGTNVDSYTFTSVGTYTFNATFTSKTAPEGYAFTDSVQTMVNAGLTYEIEIYELSDNEVTAGAGYVSNGVDDWTTGLTANDGIYTLDTNGQVVITANSNYIADSSAQGYIVLSQQTYEQASAVSKSAIKIDIPANSTYFKLVVGAVKSTSSSVKIINANGEVLTTTTTAGATYNHIVYTFTRTVDGNEAGVESYYVFAEGVATLYSVVANAQYSVGEEEIDTYNLIYWNNVDSNNNYSSNASDPYKYIDGAKVVVRNVVTSAPDHKIFDGWKNKGYANNLFVENVIEVNQASIQEDSVNLYVQVVDEQKIAITFDLNPPVGMTDDEKLIAFGSTETTKVYEIYSGESLAENSFAAPTYEMIVANSQNWEFVEWQVNGVSYPVDSNTIFDSAITLKAVWNTEAIIDVIVTDGARSVVNGTQLSNVIANLPTELVVVNVDGSATNKAYENASVLSWQVAENNVYNPTPDEATTFVFRGTLSEAPSGTKWYETWADYSYGGYEYERNNGEGEYYVYVLITVEKADSFNSYVAEFTAFSYTGSGENILYNNKSNTHDKAWTNVYNSEGELTTEGLYNEPSDIYNSNGDLLNGVTVARNGEIRVVADNKTVVGKNTPALVDLDYHGQTWSMIKGQNNTDVPFIYVAIPSGVASVKITVSGVKFRESGRDVDLNIAPLSSVSTTATMTVSAHSYTETDAGSDYNYFYEFTPTTYTYEYTGAETIFAISHVSNHSTNVYITGVRVECSVANQTEHKITYHANDGSSSPKTRQVTYFENNQDTPTESSDDAIIEKNFFERPNYEFVGWSMREGAVTADANYAVGNSIELDGPITLYAVWKLCLKITYHANDGTGDFFDTYYVNGRGPISECLLDMADRTGIFLYWNTKEDGSGTQYYPGDIWMDGEKVGQIAKNENLYAIWGEGEVYEANYFGYSYVTVDGIDHQFTNTSQTFGISWTSKYTDSVIARNGGITATVIDAITPTAGYRSAPLILLDQNAKIQVSVPYSGHVTITIHARYSGKSENVSIGGNDYQITKTFNDSQTFAPYVADKLIHTQAVSGTNDSPAVIDVVNELSGTIVISSLEISVATSDNVTSRTITYTNGIEGEGAESVTYKLIDSVELTDGSVVNYSTDGVVGVNNFINNGYKFANWTVNDSQTTVNYGDTISADADITYTANWIAETYKYQLWVDEDIDDHSAEFVKKNGEVEFTFGQEVVLGELEKAGYTFNGWFAEQECYTLVSAENGNNPFTFEMIDENGVVNVYAYFTNNNVEKTILTASTLESKSIYILDLLDDVYADQGSNSDSTVITAKGLKLPENVVVADENSATFSKNIDITWLTKGYTVGQLRFADNERTYTVEGFVKLSDEDFELYSFADNQQQAHVTIEVTIKNLVIYFTNDEPLIEKNIVVPLNTPKSTVISYLAVSGYYTDLDGIQATYAPSGLVWECAAYNPNNAQNYIFESDLVADIGYTFCTNSTEKTYAREIHALANVEVQDTSAKAGLGGVGFVRENASDWTGGVTGDFVLDVHDGLALTGIGGRFDCVNGYLKINNNVSAVEIDVPAGVRKLAIYYVANNERTGQQLLSLVDAQGNALASSSAGIVIDATTYGASITYESNEDIGTVYIKGASSAAYLSKLLVLADSLSVMSDKLVTIKYTYGGTTVYEKQILNAASVEDGENDYTAFAKGAKFALPTYATAFGTEVEGTNIEFLGWSTYPGASAPQYKAQDFIDVETDIQLYAVVGRKTINLTFNTGFGKSYTVAVPYGESTNSSNFIVYGANREQELIELENSRIGYKFVEWKMEGGGSFNPDGKLTEDNIQLFADWTERTYTIKFADESGVLNNLTLEGVSYKDLISEPTAENCPIKDNYSFRAWTYTVGEDVYDWNFFAFTLENRGVITSNSVTEFTLTASFGVKIQFVSEYDSIIGSAEPVVEDNTVYPVGYEYDLTKKVTGLHGYNFVGWSLVKNDVEKIDSVILNQNTTVYAVWTKKEITIRFVTGDNEIEFAPFEEIKYYGDTDLEEPNVSATGYVVYNWTYVDQEGKTRVWVFGGDNPTTVFLPTDEHGNDSPVITLYAQWGVNVNFVAYDTINGEEINVNPWYNQVKVSIGGTIPFINVTGSPDGSSTIHAKPVIPGYTFDRWAKGIDVNADSIDSSFVLTKENLASIGYDQASKAVTVYAIFTRNAEGMKYTVTFEDAYNTGVELPEAIEVDATVGQFTFVSSLIPQVDLSKADYIRFVGWTDNRDGSGTKYALNDVYNIGSNTTLYAFWEITINKVDKETSGADVTISEVETLQNNLINTFGGSYCDPSSKEVVHSFDNVFDAIWYLNEARFGSTSGEVVDLTAGAYGLDVGLYYVPVKLQLPTDSVFVWDNSVEGLMLEQDDQGRIWASVEILSSNYLIVEVLPITETVKYNTNYVLTTVVANLSNGSKVNLKANWNSQIDTTLLGVHYVEGEVLTGNFQFSADCVNRIAKATITITDKNGVTDANVYKIYQSTTLPNVENLNDFEFICWTDNGTNAFNGGDVAGAGAYTKVFAKLSVQSTASIRDKELLGYGGLRFTAELEFSSSKYVGQLLYSKDNKAGVIQLSMTFTGDGETIGSGAPFMNIVSTNSNTKFIFSGVLSDLPDAYLATEFTPTAILSVVRNGVAIYTTSETGPSASYNGTIS